MDQVALPEREPDPDATPLVGMRTRLLALATLCVAGSLALTGGLALHRASLEQRSIEDGALTVARAIVNAADREIAASIARMEALATSPALHAGDLEAFRSPARRDAAARRDLVRRLGPGTAAAEHAPAIRRLRCRGSPISMPGARKPYGTPLQHARPWSARWSGGRGDRPTSSRSRSPSWPRMR